MRGRPARSDVGNRPPWSGRIIARTVSAPSGPRPAQASARYFLGAAGWDHPQWSGAFYPEDLPRDWRLAYYAHFFGCVLVPQAAWRGGGRAAMTGWLGDTPPEFRFLLEMGAGAEAAARRLGARCAGLVDAGGRLRAGPGRELVVLDSAGDLRELTRRLRDRRSPGHEVYLVDRVAHLGRLRETAALLGLLGLACGPCLV